MNSQLIALSVVLSLVIWFTAQNRPSWFDLEQELEVCREEVRILRLERGVDDEAGQLAGQRGQVEQRHGRVCKVAYMAL